MDRQRPSAAHRLRGDTGDGDERLDQGRSYRCGAQLPAQVQRAGHTGLGCHVPRRQPQGNLVADA